MRIAGVQSSGWTSLPCFWYTGSVGKSGTVASAVLLALFVFSCTRNPQPAQRKSAARTEVPPAPPLGKAARVAPIAPIAPVVPVSPAGRTPATGRAAPVAPVAPAGRPPAAPPRATVPPARADTFQALHARDRDRVTLPEDFKIGRIAGSGDLDGDERAALETADRFLSALVKGKVERELLASGASAVGDTAAYHLERGDGPSAFRMGMPKPRKGGEIAANVRLFGPEGTAEGEIYMTAENREWLVSDLQISMAELQVKRERPKEKFFPSSYRWLLGE